MDSSEEDEIIFNNEDEFGDYTEISKNSKKLDKYNINKNFQISIEEKNFSKNKEEISIKNEMKSNDSKENKENDLFRNNIINNNRIKKEQNKRNKLTVVNKVIDLNINQNRNMKQELIFNNEDKEKAEYQENESNNNIYNHQKFELNNGEEIKDEKKRQIANMPTKKYTKQEFYRDKNKEYFKRKKEENKEEINIENNLMNNNNELINNKESNEDEKGAEFEEATNILINKETKNVINNPMLEGDKNQNKKSNIMNKKESWNNILKEKEMNNENILNKEKEKSNVKPLSEKRMIESSGKRSEKNKTESSFKKQDNYDKDKEEEINFIKDKIKLDKNFLIQSNGKEKNIIIDDKHCEEFNKDKSINFEQLNENQNFENKNTKKSRNKLESQQNEIQKNINNIKDINKNENKIYKESNYVELKNPKQSIEKNLFDKNNNQNNSIVSINNNIKKKINYNSSAVFHTLLDNKTFRKFLNNKLEKSKNSDDEIPKKFIQNLSLKKEKRNKNKEQNPLENNDSITNVNYSIFYNEDSYQIPLTNKNFRRTINTQNISPKMNNIQMNFVNRYSKDVSVPQYDNLNDSISKIESHRFTTTCYPNYNENISDLTLKNQKLHDKILELQNQIRASKNEMNMKNSELQKYLSSYDKMTLENNLNKEKIDELKKELKFQKGEMNQKQNKISELESINNNLKNEMTKLQRNYDEETSMNKETKQNYDLIKSNYNDIKNQYDLLNIKYQTLTDENFNYKRDKALYEKQIKTKNQMIESLIENKNNILNNKLYNLDIIDEKEKTNHELFLDYLQNRNLPKEKPKKEEKDNGMTKNRDDENTNDQHKIDIDYTKFDKLTYPELQSKRDELINERKSINNIFNKIPIKPNYKSQIEKRNEYEKMLNEINCDLAIIKLRMKKLKN